MSDEPLVPGGPMSRRNDPLTSHEAADVVEPHLGKIQRLVLDVFESQGPMTARVAEGLRPLRDYGFSTVRKRISELAKLGYLEKTGVDRSGRAPATIYAARGWKGQRRML